MHTHAHLAIQPRIIAIPLTTATLVLLIFRPPASESAGVHAVTTSWVAAARQRLQLDPVMPARANGSGSRPDGGYAAQGVEETAPPFAESMGRAHRLSFGCWNLRLHVHREVCALYHREESRVHLRRNDNVDAT